MAPQSLARALGHESGYSSRSLQIDAVESRPTGTIYMALEPGQRLGAFEILAPLGKGGMGEVYRAKGTKLEREVAVKILPEEMAGRPERMARFEGEAKLLATLDHAPDGRFVMLRDVEPDRVPERRGLVVIPDFFDDLKAKMAEAEAGR